jgi:formiminoglutamase
MSDIALFFSPVNFNSGELTENSLGSNITIYLEENKFPEIDNCKIVLFGVKEERGTPLNSGTAQAPDETRKYLYKLVSHWPDLPIADIGNIIQGEKYEDTLAAVEEVIHYFKSKGVFTILIGGGQELSFATYKGFCRSEKMLNFLGISNSFNLGKVEDKLSSKSYLNKILLHQPGYLFNYSNIGYQTYFVNPADIETLTKFHFELYRLGEIQHDITEAEPIIRNADMVSFDISAIRASDAPGNKLVTPNGFYGEEACRLARYIGLSDKTAHIGFYEMNPDCDNADQTAHLLAQMIWYVLEGFYQRKDDLPFNKGHEFLKYIVSTEEEFGDLVFYKNLRTDRWWMNVPTKLADTGANSSYLVPCSYSDYKKACDLEIPEKWLKTFFKLV